MNITRIAAIGLLASQLALGWGLPGDAAAAGAVASALDVDGSRRSYWAGNEPTVQAAEAAAMASCEAGQKQHRHGRCSISGSADGPGYWAASKADNGAVGYGASWNRETAIKNAYEACAKHGKCAAAPAEVWFDAGQTAKAGPAAAAAPAAAAPPPRQAIYRTVSASGQVMYSDTPQRGAKTLP